MSIASIPPAGSGFTPPPAGARGGEAAPAPSLPSGTPAPAVVVTGSGQNADAAELNAALERIREALAPVARNLQFSVDDDTGKTVVRIIDSSTNEVIKQFPSEEMLAISRSIDKLQGLLLRQEA